MRTILVDSENVGNRWLDLLKEKSLDKIIVFYTKKSGGIPYESLEDIFKFKSRIEFVKCVDGINALDFQLVAELGFLLRESSPKDEWIIISNDKGYDAAVSYFTAKGYLVARGNMYEYKQASKNEVIETVEEVKQIPQDNVIDEPDTDVHERQAKEICSYFGKNKLTDCYSAIVGMFGQDEGIKLYQKIKKDIGNATNISSNEKIKGYTAIILANCENKPDADQIDVFLIESKSKMKNLNSFRAACTSHYGKQKGELIYNIFKPHAKFMLKL